DVAAVAADVSCIYTHWNVRAFVAQLEIEAYFVPCTTSAIGRMGTRGWGGRWPTQSLFPWALLTFQTLQPYLILVDAAGIHHPNDSTACIFLLHLHADDVSGLSSHSTPETSAPWLLMFLARTC